VHVKIKVITASAGSGKTTRLSEVLDDAIASGTVRPEGIIATTFTRHAAAELIERARGKLLANGRGREAHQLLAARIGTVNSVCGALVTEFAFELGLSPDLRVLDETAAELEQQRALATIVSSEISDELYGFRGRFDRDLDWRTEVRQLIAAARSNGLSADDLRRCAERSSASLDACLGPVAPSAAVLDDALEAAIQSALDEIAKLGELKKTTSDYVLLLDDARRNLERGRLRWGDWAKLTKEKPAKQGHAAAAPVIAAAEQHRAHPRLRGEMHRLIHLLFHVAADGLAAYQAHKHTLGAIDFIDQEALCLTLLRRTDVREALAGQIDLVLIDEFQDTSPLQLAIFLELAALARESVWVGDQKQAIFGFRGTDPALMDAMIESLTSPITDPELVSKTVAAVGATGELETLGTSYRSRKDLVHLTSDVFARAFIHHGIPEDRTRLAPVDKREPAELGPIIEHWPLLCPDRVNKVKLANCTATGVRDLLDAKPNIRDRRTNLARTATAGDVAVLCRTNEQCDQIAEALSLLGIPAVLPRVGLFSTAEGQLLLAALALWIDPRDSLAAANLARLVTYATDLDALVHRALTTPGSDAFADDPLVRAVLDARTRTTDLDPVATVTTLIDATNLRDLAASWGRAAQRLANLDALRAHAAAYVAHSTARREAPTLVGLLAYFEAMAEEWGWKVTRSDDQALLDSGNAVTVSTWHAAKGREWPLVVLYGLEALREPRAFGLHVETDAERFELSAPLAGRWLRYWPNPYSKPNQNGAVKDAFAASTEFSAVVARHEREALRLLYVGWTRARDRLIVAAAEGKLLDGLLGILVKLDPTLISEPTGSQVTWAGRDLDVPVRACAPSDPLAPPLEAGTITVGRPLAAFPPARQSPSTAEPVACTIGAPITIGPRLSLRGAPEMGALGDAVHAFLAADRPEHPQPERIARASRLLAAHGVASHLDPGEVADAALRLWTWFASMPASRLHREWPIAERLPEGTLVAGTADLVALTDAGYILVDHKTFPGTLEAALARLHTYSGQLATYARAIAAATSAPVISMWIHLPVLGTVVPVQLA
jgi:ATP-dependent exoDNAse (exonuclease V) beta subunit